MVKINFANMNNIELISEFERENFYKEAYSYDTLSEMLKDNYILKDNDNIITINDGEEIIGYIIFHISKDFADIYKIYVREKNKREGHGTALIEYVENLAKRFNSRKMMIEVRSKNEIALRFYQKNGFTKVDIRKNYYKEPNDDAIILEKKVNE